MEGVFERVNELGPTRMYLKKLSAGREQTEAQGRSA